MSTFKEKAELVRPRIERLNKYLETLSHITSEFKLGEYTLRWGRYRQRFQLLILLDDWLPAEEVNLERKIFILNHWKEIRDNILSKIGDLERLIQKSIETFDKEFTDETGQNP